MRKSSPKAKKESLPVTEVVAVDEVQVPVVVQEPEAPPKPASKAPKKVARKTVTETKSTDTPTDVASVTEEISASAKVGKQGKAKKVEPKKAKLIRDSFTFPEPDYLLLSVLKQRALAARREIKKSELLRAGLKALNAMPDEELFKALDGVERIKTGRPSK